MNNLQAKTEVALKELGLIIQISLELRKKWRCSLAELQINIIKFNLSKFVRRVRILDTR